MIGGLNFDGCCHVSELQDLCFSVHVVLSILKFAFRGFMCVKSGCFFCILEIRAVVYLAEVGDSCWFGLIHPWQVRGERATVVDSQIKRARKF